MAQLFNMLQVKCCQRSINIDRQGVPYTRGVPQQRSAIYSLLYLLYTLARSRHYRWWNGGLSDLEDPERLT